MVGTRARASSSPAPSSSRPETSPSSHPSHQEVRSSGVNLPLGARGAERGGTEFQHASLAARRLVRRSLAVDSWRCADRRRRPSAPRSDLDALAPTARGPTRGFRGQPAGPLLVSCWPCATQPASTSTSSCSRCGIRTPSGAPATSLPRWLSRTPPPCTLMPSADCQPRSICDMSALEIRARAGATAAGATRAGSSRRPRLG